MKHTHFSHLLRCLCGGALALTLGSSHAVSDMASSASSAGSSASGSLSESLDGSSNSSQGDARVAEGEWRVTDVAAAPTRPGHVRVRLAAPEPLAAGDVDALSVTVTQAAAAAQGLVPGALVHVAHRPYGLAFNRPGAAPFYLAIADDWQRGLTATPVTL